MRAISRHCLTMTAALLVAAPLSAQGGLRMIRPARSVAHATTVAAVQQLYTVRVAAFADPSGRTADRLAASLRARGVPVWIEHGEQQGQEISRLRIGVLNTEKQAEVLQRALENRLHWPTYVARVQDRRSLPARALPATLSFIRSY